MWCPRVSECWRGVRPRSPGCDQAGAHRVFLTSGAQLLPDLWRERWNTMVTSISTDINSDNSEYLQILFLALLLSSCHGQEYPAKVDLVISRYTKFCQEIDSISQTAWFSTKLYVRIYLGIIQLQFLLMMHGLCIKPLPSEKKNVCFDEWTRERSMEETFLR